MTTNEENLYKNWSKYYVFKCHENSKIPAETHGYKDAKTGQNVSDIVKQGYNVALALAPSKLIAIDMDFHNPVAIPYEELEELEEELGKLPKTLTQSTASGKGRHLIFSVNSDIKPKGKLSSNIDIKYNGYIMIAPSSINGTAYKIIDGIGADGSFIIAELPENWLQYINGNSDSFFKNKKPVKKIYEKIDIKKLFEKCAFLQHCEEDADTLSEPEWHTMCGTLAIIEDSDDLIHELSEPYPNYTYEETKNYIDKARDFGFSKTCRTISADYPEYCKNCPHKGKKHMNPLKTVENKGFYMFIKNRKTRIIHSTPVINSPFYYEPADLTASESKQKDLLYSVKEFNSYLLSNDQLLENLKNKKGFTPETVKALGIGYDKKRNVYSFPQIAYNIDADLQTPFIMNIEFRDRDIKYDTVYTLQNCSAGLIQAGKYKQTATTLIITDGIINAMSYWQLFKTTGKTGFYHIITSTDGADGLLSHMKQIHWSNYTGCILALKNGTESEEVFKKLRETYQKDGKTKLADGRISCKKCSKPCRHKDTEKKCVDINNFIKNTQTL